MWKKLSYAGIAAILLYFIYAVFFKKIPSPLEQMQKEMKAKKVVYKLKDEAIIYADEQIGSPKGDIVKFKGVIVDLLKKDILISGKEGEVNTKTSDITLKGNVVGATKDDKWTLYTEHVDYKKEGDLIIAPTRTRILNSVDDTRLEADRAETTTKFEIINGTGNVLYVDNKQQREIRADKAVYNTPVKVLDAEGNVVYDDKKENRRLSAGKMRYDDINKIGDAEINAVYNDFKNKRELRADKMRIDEINQIGNAVGNVRYKDPENSLSAHKVDYFMAEERIYGEGSVVYSGRQSLVNADRATYWIKKKQVEGFGNVKYTGKEMIITGDHVFYDENAKIVNGDGNGTFNHMPRKTTGTFQVASYDMNTEVLTANQAYTMNYEDYRLAGTNLVYAFKTGDATFHSKFAVTKQNFNVNGANGRMNTVTKDIFANRMVMTSVQGDIITSDTGQGSFEKKEFRFDGNVNGKIRGNVKNFVTNPTKLVDSEAVHFKGETSKLYFISQNDKNMSITRGEIKNNVHMIYKDVVMDSQYNEIDIAKNTILARDKVTVDFRNDTKMTAGYVWFDMNKEEGHAENNVKLISKLPQLRNVNTSADKATISLKDRKIRMNGNVLFYQGKTSISSKSATYDMNNKIVENRGNIRMTYQLNTDGNEETANRSNPADVAAVEEVISRLSVSASGSQVSLPRSMTSSNGKNVSIKWKSSNSTILPVTGRINKQFYGGSGSGVTLTATAKSGIDEKSRDFTVSVPVESAGEMLRRAAKNVYVPENGGTLPSSVKVNISKGTINVPISWTLNGEPASVSGSGKLVGILRYAGEEYRINK